MDGATANSGPQGSRFDACQAHGFCGRLRGDTNMEDKPAYVSRARIVRERGPIRRAFLPVESEPVIFGTHSEVREHYGTAPDQYPEHASTLDYVVAAAAG